MWIKVVFIDPAVLSSTNPRNRRTKIQKKDVSALFVVPQKEHLSRIAKRNERKKDLVVVVEWWWWCDLFFSVCILYWIFTSLKGTYTRHKRLYSFHPSAAHRRSCVLPICSTFRIIACLKGILPSPARTLFFYLVLSYNITLRKRSSTTTRIQRSTKLNNKNLAPMMRWRWCVCCVDRQ